MEGNVSIWDGFQMGEQHQEAMLGECGHDSSQIDPTSDRDIKCTICWENREILIKRLIEPFEHAFALKDDSPPLSNVRGSGTTRTATFSSSVTTICSAGVTKNIATPVASPKRLRLRSASRRKPGGLEHKDAMMRSASLSDADMTPITPISPPKGASTSPQLGGVPTKVVAPLHETSLPVRERQPINHSKQHPYSQLRVSDDEAEECIRVKDISMDPPGSERPLIFTGKGGPGSGFSAGGATTWQFPAAPEQKDRKTSSSKEEEQHSLTSRKPISKSKLPPKRPKSASFGSSGGGGGAGGTTGGQQTLLTFFLPKLSHSPPGDKEPPPPPSNPNPNPGPKFPATTATLKKEVQKSPQVDAKARETDSATPTTTKELPLAPQRRKSTRGRELKAVNYNEDSDSEGLLN
ncbi:hypothetical protein RUND412_007081 [Rhizina undulata]